MFIFIIYIFPNLFQNFIVYDIVQSEDIDKKSERLPKLNKHRTQKEKNLVF